MKQPKLPALKNYQVDRMARDAFNPYRQAHTAKAYEVKKPKTGFKMPEAPKLGSPWTTMGEKK